jgi:hypothetical protein
MSWTRGCHKAGSALLLIGAGLHLTAHWRAYVAVQEFEPARRAAMQALQSYVLYPPLGTTLWTALGFFSLGYGALLALLGTTHWVLAREADPRTLRRHALRNAVLAVLAAGAALALHPLPQGVAVLALAALLFGLAALPRPDDV